MIYLVDTNVISEPMKPSPNQSLLRALDRHRLDLATAAPVWHEMWHGCLRLPKSKKRRQLEEFLEDVVRRAIPILPYDEDAASWHSAERVRLSRRGRPPSFTDGQIAAIAVTNQLILVTRNTKHFTGFRDLKMEDWSYHG